VALPPAAPATSVGGVPGGPSKGFVALLGLFASAVLVRYLSYSTKLRRL
jgi:MYXO-CTERM domain-containing protein